MKIVFRVVFNFKKSLLKTKNIERLGIKTWKIKFIYVSRNKMRSVKMKKKTFRDFLNVSNGVCYFVKFDSILFLTSKLNFFEVNVEDLIRTGGFLCLVFRNGLTSLLQNFFYILSIFWLIILSRSKLENRVLQTREVKFLIHMILL